MSKTDSNDKNNADTKQDRARILRARDIIPGASKGRSEKNSSPMSNISDEHANAGRRAGGIPTFDLAEEILAEQRKITAIKRKAPGKKSEAPAREQKARPIGYAVKQPVMALSKQELLIAEIVARDIERLCGLGSSAVW